MKPETLRTLELPRAFRGYDREAVRKALDEAAGELESSELERCELVDTLEKALREQRLLLESFEQLTRDHAVLLARGEPARREPLPRPAPAGKPAERTRWERLADRLAGRPATSAW